MNKRKSPISVASIQLYAYNLNEGEYLPSIDELPYDDRREFAIEENPDGVAVKLKIYNGRYYDKGARRNIAVTIVDTTSREEVAAINTKVYLRKDTMSGVAYLDFQSDRTIFEVGRSYRLTVVDINSSETLDETEFRFDKLIDDFIKAQNEDAVAEETPAGAAESSPFMALDNLTGLKSVKEKLAVYERLVRFNKMRSDKGLPTPEVPLHAMFLGSPGTGKTTVAKRMGLMLRRAGVLSRGHVVVKERATLLGQNYSSESENTIKALEEAQGGILFIDEAYQLYQRNDPRDPGKFVIETLLTALANDGNRDWMLILAGYPDEMLQMFEMNPGFKSRIPESNIYRFDDFTSGELMEIAETYFSRFSYVLSSDARAALSDRLNADYSRRDKTFGNARHVMNIIQTEILPAMAVRVTNDTNPAEDTLSIIRAADITRPTALQPAPARRRVGFLH